MYKQQGLLICLLLLSVAYAQTDFRNTCQNASLLNGLGTGLINLNPLDTYNAGANKDFYKDITLNQFAAIDVIGYAFALSGFQAACGVFYSLSVSNVAFENQNSRMRITVDFRNPANGAITTWNMVAFTYILVSRNLNGAYSDIWASVAEATTIAVPSVLGAIDTVGQSFQLAPAGPVKCGVYQDPNFIFDSTCVAGTLIPASTGDGGSLVVHYYVMGFRWNPNKTTNDYISLGVQRTAIPVATDEITVGSDIVYAAVSPAPNGPRILIFNPNSALEYIKVGFVFSRYDSSIGTAAVGTPTYPSGSTNQIYSASYIFTPITIFNTSISITRGSGGFNLRYYHLPDARYAIYGLSQFQLPRSATTTCSQININAVLNSVDSITINTPNSVPNNFFFQADIFTRNVDNLCNPTIANPSILRSTAVVTVGQKSYFTIPTQSINQFIQEDGSIPAVTTVPQVMPAGTNPSFAFQNYGAFNGNNDTITFQTQIPFIGLTAGAPLKFQFGYYDTVKDLATLAGITAGSLPAATLGATMIQNSFYEVTVAVNGLTIYYQNYKALKAATAAPLGDNANVGIFKGININTTTANVVITIKYQRSLTVNQNVWFYINLQQYALAYDPSTGCCVTGCPALTGLNVQINPPTCIYCNTQAGLFYNPNNGTCTCLSGYYLDPAKTYQCFACTALYCSICTPATPTQCTTCVTGAVLNNVTLTCTCGTGYFVNGTTCQVCPYQCQTCNSPNGACATCVDSQNRDQTQNCACKASYFDSGSVNCTACSATCKTCTNASACTSCDATKFRNLTGTVCSCNTGYYELYNADGSRTCQLCSPQCLTCAVSPTSCTACDATRNRVAGVDSYGRQTCNCLPGFYSTPDGSCVQSNCNADPFCSQCEQGLQLCIQCQASRNRIIKQPESICVCMDGFYADANNTCQPCSSGCGVCSSATNCTSCVPLATATGTGSCTCPNQTYFTVSSLGVRYCAACGQNCNACVSATTCTTCLPSFTKSVDNQCFCGGQKFVDSKGNCSPCSSGCQNCSSATVCNQCISPLVLQGAVCQATCNSGFTNLGSVCTSCPTGCSACTQNLNCYYCADNYYIYNGNCYDVCPAGTIGDKSGGNWKCAPCNSPCKTCLNHPSFCTSCESGKGYLQTSAVQQSCVDTCIDGTFASNGVCQVCDFKCATCLGTASNCISCPRDQFLYQGGCWAACPAILLAQVGIAASCVDKCPDGYYKVSTTSCAPCSAQCTTCEGGPNNCTSCQQGSVTVNGTCSVKCGENEFSFQGICVACSSSCYGCSVTPQNCLSCAPGHVLTGSICQKGCLSNQYYDNSQRKCLACSSSCATCSSFSYCTTCTNPAITPRGGVCSNCPYPCSTCSATGTCTACLSGFYFFQNACQQSCPSGAFPLNGICQCSSGIVSNGNCVTSCSSGFTAVGGTCQPCNSNCAECSGTINSCTSCISGFAIDAISKTCVSSTTCPYGQGSSNGVCQKICDPGFFYYEGICIYGGCFTGYASNGYGGCVRSAAPKAGSGPTCPPNQYISNGQCVGSCSSGFYPDSNSMRCLPCSGNCVNCFSNNFCIICNSGFSISNGVCVASSSCPSSQYSYNGACVNTCPVGTFTSGSQCVRSCPTGNYYLSQICYITCPTPLRTEAACVVSCPSGTTNNNGVCS